MTDISTNPIIIPIIRDLNGLLNDGNLLEDSFNNDEKRKVRPLSHEVRDKLGEYKVTDEDKHHCYSFSGHHKFIKQCLCYITPKASDILLQAIK